MGEAALLENHSKEPAPSEHGRNFDERTISALYRKYAPGLRRHAQRLVGSAAEAEDVVQEAFVRLWKRGNLETLDAPSAVLFTTTFRLALNAIRKRRASAIDGASNLDDLPLPDLAYSPEDHLVAKQELAAYQNALATLPSQCRRVFTLRQVQGYSFKEIGETMGLAVSTLEKHMTRGKRLFQEALLAEANCSEEDATPNGP